jgi:hypothetical protein
MPQSQKNFVVFGPGGRCGSHWVETILINLLGVKHTVDSFTMLPTGWIYHTNREADVLELPSEIKNSVTLVYCDRKNYFDVAVSKMVAEISDEWFFYTSKTIEPFVADTARFEWLINDLHYVRTKKVPADILPLFTNLVSIDYDRLISSEIPEKYIADRLGIDYDANKNYSQTDSEPSNKNTRNYKDLILNWDELVDIYKVFSWSSRTINFR